MPLIQDHAEGFSKATLVCDNPACKKCVDVEGVDGWVQCKAVGRNTTIGVSKIKNAYFCSRPCLIEFFSSTPTVNKSMEVSGA